MCKTCKVWATKVKNGRYLVCTTASLFRANSEHARIGFYVIFHVNVILKNERTSFMVIPVLSCFDCGEVLQISTTVIKYMCGNQWNLHPSVQACVVTALAKYICFDLFSSKFEIFLSGICSIQMLRIF